MERDADCLSPLAGRAAEGSKPAQQARVRGRRRRRRRGSEGARLRPITTASLRSACGRGRPSRKRGEASCAFRQDVCIRSPRKRREATGAPHPILKERKPVRPQPLDLHPAALTPRAQTYGAATSGGRPQVLSRIRSCGFRHERRRRAGRAAGRDGRRAEGDDLSAEARSGSKRSSTRKRPAAPPPGQSSGSSTSRAVRRWAAPSVMSAEFVAGVHRGRRPRLASAIAWRGTSPWGLIVLLTAWLWRRRL